MASQELGATSIGALPWLVMMCVTGAYLALSVVGHAPAFIFELEHARFFENAFALSQGEPLTWLGAPVGPFSYHHGPVFYFLLAPWMWLSADPLFLHLILLACFSAAGFSLFAALKRVVEWPVAVFAVAGLLFSHFAFEAGRQLWHSSLIPFFACFFLLCAARLLTDPQPALRWCLGAALSAGIALQLHVQAGVYGLLLLGVVGLRWRVLGLRKASITLGVAALSIMPILWAFALVAFEDGDAQRANFLHESSHVLPANPLDVLIFFSAELSPSWIGVLDLSQVPLWPALLIAGIVVTIRERSALGWLLIANVGIGLMLQFGLLNYGMVPRYLHANVYAVFGLGAMGLDGVIRLIRSVPVQRAIHLILGALVLLSVLDAFTAPVPDFEPPLLTAHEQRALAAVVAPALPKLEEASKRVHGAYTADAGHRTGIHFFHRVLAGKTSDLKFNAEAHVLVTTSEQNMVPFARKIYDTRVVTEMDRELRVIAYQPAILSGSVQIRGPRADSLLQHWPSGPDSSQNNQVHTLDFEVSQRGELNVLVRGHAGECPVRVTQRGALVQSSATRRSPLGEYRRVSLNAAGAVHLVMGPCSGLVFLDLF